MPSIEHLNGVEAAWLLAAVIGLYLGWANLRESQRDRARAEDEPSNGLRPARLVVANGYVFRNRMRVAIFVWWVFVGVLYGFFNPPEIPRLAGLLGLIGTVIGWSVVGAQEQIERRTLSSLVARHLRAQTASVAAETIEQRAAVVAAQLEVVAQEAALRLREIARSDNRSMSSQMERTAKNTERIADNTEGLRSQSPDSEGDQR